MDGASEVGLENALQVKRENGAPSVDGWQDHDAAVDSRFRETETNRG